MEILNNLIIYLILLIYLPFFPLMIILYLIKPKIFDDMIYEEDIIYEA